MSVKDLVKKGLDQEKRDREEELKQISEGQKELKKRKIKEAQRDIDNLMKNFEKKFFDIEATEEYVAKKIVENSCRIIQSEFLRQVAFKEEDLSEYKEEEFRRTISGYELTKSVDDYNFYLITEYDKYNKWRQAFRDKFGITIGMGEEEHAGESRGYDAPPDRESYGIEAWVRVL